MVVGIDTGAPPIAVMDKDVARGDILQVVHDLGKAGHIAAFIDLGVKGAIIFLPVEDIVGLIACVAQFLSLIHI